MRAVIVVIVWLFGMLASSRTAAAADAEGCADLKLLPRLEGCVIQECSAKQHESFDTAGANIAPGIPGPLEASENSLTYSCPASMDLQRLRQELDAAIHKAGFLNVAEDKADPANPVITTRKGSHWIRWGASSEDGGTSYTVTTAAGGVEKFKAEACVAPQVLSLAKSCEIVECTSKAEDSVGMRTAQKEQTSVAGTVQTITLSCPATAPAQALMGAEEELKRSGFEILFSDHERPESGWLTGRAGNHWVELVSGPDGDSISYALTSIASGEVVGAPHVEAAAGSAPESPTPTPPPPLPAPAPASPPPVDTAAETQNNPAPPPALLRPESPAAVPAETPAPVETPAPAPVPALAPTPAASPGSFVPPRPMVQTAIQASHDLVWSVTGSVAINMLVDVNEDGAVTNAVLTGRITRDVLKLESAAREAVSHWRFEPARQDGRVVPAVKIPIQLHFQGRPWQY
ncbi:MAG TPA: energy transducer TonB [Bryobacteraceae bacterium]|nr:energy transducer TonB [Bryobacteraceae bacterium]